MLLVRLLLQVNVVKKSFKKKLNVRDFSYKLILFYKVLCMECTFMENIYFQTEIKLKTWNLFFCCCLPRQQYVRLTQL